MAFISRALSADTALGTIEWRVASLSSIGIILRTRG